MGKSYKDKEKYNRKNNTDLKVTKKKVKSEKDILIEISNKE